MKKILAIILALMFLFSFNGAAFAAAANPFADVPTNHWAYSALAELAKAGIIDGYGDGTFRGEKTMTRYEMAQVVANALTKEDKANAEDKVLINKLATEFASELNQLGARVSNVEKKVDKLEANTSNIKLTGWDRIRYIQQDKGTTNPTFSNRFDLMLDANPTNNIFFHARDVLSNYTPMGTYPTGSGSSTANKTNQIADVNITYKGLMPGFDVMVGRYSLNLSQTGYLAGSTGGFDGIEVNWKSGKGNLQFGYADSSVVNLANFNNSASTFANVANFYYGQYTYQPDSNIKFDINYVKSESSNGNQTSTGWPSTTSWAPGQNLIEIIGAGATWKLDKDWSIVGDYWRNSATQAKIDNGGSSPVGYVGRLAYKGNSISIPGSWGAFVEYQKFQPDTWDANWTVSFLSPVSTAADPHHGAYKGWDFQYNSTLAKNFTFTAIYAWSLKNTITGDNYMPNGGNNWTRMQITYFF